MATSTDLNAAIDAVQGSLRDGAPPPLGPTTTGEEAVAEAPGLAAALQKRLGVLPWWMISVIVHAILLFLSYPLWYAWGMERGYTIWGRRPYQEGSLYLFRMNKPGEILPGEKEKKKEETN